LHFKDMDRTQLLLSQNERLSESELLSFHFAIKKLKAGEPLQYVLGTTYFCGLQFNVDSRVLIPRPETEELVQTIIALNRRSNPLIVDVGTGSGCIAISLAKKIPESKVFAVDISAGALEVASKNAEINKVHIQLYELNVLESDLPLTGIDILVSNPPYVLKSEREQMMPNVLNYEPPIALFVPDDDPLLFYKRLFDIASKHLNQGGILACEMHEEMEQKMKDLFWDLMQGELTFLKDMQGKTRFFIYNK